MVQRGEGMVTRMRRLRAICSALLVFAVGCIDDSWPTGEPVRAQVLELSSTDPVAFELVERELPYLRDLNALDGDWLIMHQGGELRVRAIDQDVVTDGRFARTGDNQLRYVVEGGAVVARDYSTLMMLSAYYQFGRLFESLERVSGFTPAGLIADIGQLEVFFEPVIVVEGDIDGTASIKANAFYVPGQSQFGLARRSSVEIVPLAANRMVLAHEFGHALFERTFYPDGFVDCTVDSGEGRFVMEYATRGMNEGFADFMSFAITGTTNPLVGSIDSDRVAERDLADSVWTYSDLGGATSACDGAFYCLGTLFARSLYQAMTELGYDPADEQARGEFARQVVEAMGVTRETMLTQSSAILPPPTGEVTRCEPRAELVPRYDGQVAGAFLNAFVQHMPAASLVPLCDAFERNFGLAGFPAQARAVCSTGREASR